MIIWALHSCSSTGCTFYNLLLRGIGEGRQSRRVTVIVDSSEGQGVAGVFLELEGGLGETFAEVFV